MSKTWNAPSIQIAKSLFEKGLVRDKTAPKVQVMTGR